MVLENSVLQNGVNCVSASGFVLILAFIGILSHIFQPWKFLESGLGPEKSWKCEQLCDIFFIDLRQ